VIVCSVGFTNKSLKKSFGLTVRQIAYLQLKSGPPYLAEVYFILEVPLLPFVRL
jgi:hypothetical protein